METELVSIIVPVYNVENYLEQCLDGILNQSYSYLEIFLIDDGSTDHCPAICDEYAKKDERVHVIHQRNSGLSAARNAGIDRAKGSFLAFVDSDDVVEPEMIRIMYEAMKRDSSDLVICNYRGMDEYGKLLAGKHMAAGCWTRDDFWKAYYEERVVFCAAAWNKLYKKEFFDDIRYPVRKLHEDQFVIHKIIEKSNKISICEEVLYYYRQRSGSIMNVTYSVTRLDEVEAQLERAQAFLDSGEFKWCAEAILRCFRAISYGFNKLDLRVEQNRYRCQKLRKESIQLYRMLRQHDISLSCRLEGTLFMISWRLHRVMAEAYKKLNHIE